MSMNQVKTRIGNIVTPRPNWADRVSEEYEFATKIFVSRDGTEQRNAHRTWPRVAVEFTSDQTGPRAQRLLSDLNTQLGGETLLLPVRWRRETLAADLPASSVSLTLNSAEAPWWLVAGIDLILESTDTQEVVKVDSVSGSTVTLTDVTAAAFSALDAVYLALPGRMGQAGSFRAARAGHKRMAVRFEVDPGAWNPDPGVAPTLAHEGYPILWTKPNWRDTVSLDFDDMRGGSDHGRGVRTNFWPIDHLSISEQWTFTGFSQAYVDDLLSFFLYVRGRQKPFWVPSQYADFTPVGTTAAGATTLTVEDDEGAPAFYQDRLHQTLFVRWPDGCFQLNRITAIGTSGGNSILTLRDPWERDISGAEQLSWGYLARFMNDLLRVDWETDRAANLSVGIRAVASDYVDLVGDDLHDDTVPSVPFDGAEGSVDQPWDPELYPYGEWDFVYSGVPLGCIDRGLADFTATFGCHIPNSGTSAVTLTLKCWFFDADMVELTSPDGAGAQTLVVSRLRCNTLDLEITLPPVAIPVNTRFVRVRGAVNRPFESGVGDSYVLHQNWGTIRDMENLKCP